MVRGSQSVSQPAIQSAAQHRRAAPDSHHRDIRCRPGKREVRGRKHPPAKADWQRRWRPPQRQHQWRRGQGWRRRNCVAAAAAGSQSTPPLTGSCISQTCWCSCTLSGRGGCTQWQPAGCDKRHLCKFVSRHICRCSWLRQSGSGRQWTADYLIDATWRVPDPRGCGCTSRSCLCPCTPQPIPSQPNPPPCTVSCAPLMPRMQAEYLASATSESDMTSKSEM